MHLQKLHDKCSCQLLATFFAGFRAAFFEAFGKAFGEACRKPLIPSPFKYTYAQIAHGIHHPFFVFIQINLIFLLQSFPLLCAAPPFCISHF